MKDSTKKLLINFSIIIGVIALIIIVFFSTYYFSINKSYKSYEKNIQNIVNSINETNNNIANLSNSDTYNSELVSKELSSKIQHLNDIKSKLNDLNPTDKYKKSYNHLNDGLKNNITMYNYLLILINKPLDKNIESSIKKLKLSKDDCINYYSIFDINNLKITLPEKTIQFVNNSTNYVYEKIRVERDKEISQNQLIEFSNNIDTILNDFLSIKTDYPSMLLDARKNLIEYKEISTLINTNISKLKTLKRNLYNISVPENQSKIYDSLKNVFTTYESYLESFKYSLAIEKIKVKNTNSDIKTFDKLYENPKRKLSDTNINYDKFISLYKEFKKDIYK
ncbi:hypothetical protein ACFIJ5_02260 [Haloimpatiens sp. FM7330]|uniref:hypothetical protein n=1 Tax=Haloimpatiens sp. FM7330 TaxID=3298610 RepID=UPI00363A4BF0